LPGDVTVDSVVIIARTGKHLDRNPDILPDWIAMSSQRSKTKQRDSVIMLRALARAETAVHDRVARSYFHAHRDLDR